MCFPGALFTSDFGVHPFYALSPSVSISMMSKRSQKQGRRGQNQSSLPRFIKHTKVLILKKVIA